MNIAKKLKNLVVFEAEDKEFNEFIERMNLAHMKIVPVQVPKVMSQVDSSYINSKWNSNKIDDSIFYGKNRDTGIIAFSNNEINERIINDIIAKKEMNCKTFKFIPYNTEGDLNTKWYKDGQQIYETIERMPIKKYNIARCLK